MKMAGLLDRATELSGHPLGRPQYLSRCWASAWIVSVFPILGSLLGRISCAPKRAWS